MLDVIEIIVENENLDFNSVLNNLLLPPGDLIRFRVISNDTSSGTIPFISGTQLIEAGKKALRAVSIDMENPSSYHKRLYSKHSEDFLNTCRLGQTERGSYITTIYCPFIEIDLDDNVNNLTIFSEGNLLGSSFTRRVTKRLMACLSAIKDSALNGETEILTNPLYETFTSGNLIEAVLDLSNVCDEATIDISTSYHFKAVSTNLLVNSVSITEQEKPFLETLARSLKPSTLQYQSNLVGKISDLHAAPNVEDRTSGEITFNYLDESDRSAKAKIVLQAEDYQNAVVAHAQGQAIRVIGVVRGGGRNRTIEVDSFSILE